MIAAIIVIPLDPNDRYFLIAAGVLAAFGAADDRFDLDYRIKLLGQLLAILIVVIGGDAQIHSITLDERLLRFEAERLPLGLADVRHLSSQSSNHVEEGDRVVMRTAAAQQDPGFAKNVVGCQEASSVEPLLKNGFRGRIPRVAR